MEDEIAPVHFSKDFLEEFDDLYAKYLRERFHAALANLTRAVTALLDDKFPSSHRSRLYVDPGRVKSPNRLLLKAQTAKYRDSIHTPADIFLNIRDIVGTRITCNTLSDVYAVIDAIKACADNDNPARILFKLHDDWEDDYIKHPKDSGYRAVNLIVGVPVPTGSLMKPVTCEIQIRTLLQHAWGELTHEDTYKPGVKVPELVQVLSKRLATALAVLDEIAQDLRNELSKVERPQPGLEAFPESLAPAARETATEEARTSEAPPIDQQMPEEPPPTPLLPQAPEPAEVPQLNAGAITSAFQAAFDREPTIADTATEEIIKELMVAGFSSSDEVAAALRTADAPLRELEFQYERVRLTDMGRLRAAIQFRKSPETGSSWAKDVLHSAAERAATEAATEERFKAAYPTGREALGSVVYVGPDYALVQLPEGDTGILHVTNMKEYPGEYVNVRSLIGAGDTVRIRILKSDSASKRIELELIRQ